jgi:exopolyphosphatase/guanosine-5'-triphosphate,3'-diphosphate pyrophosphatase
VRRACIDIGSNTTRLLVADCLGGGLVEVHQDRVFTHVGRSRLADGSVEEQKIRQVASVVDQQVRAARALGAEEVRVVATAAIRSAPNGSEVVTAVLATAGVEVEILSDEREARLAFVGVARTLGHRPEGQLGVADVGGGSSELVVGTPPDGVTWWASFELGSGQLAHRYLASDPPSQGELGQVRQAVQGALADLDVPQPAEAAAVGGSAASLATVAGPLLDSSAFSRAIGLLASRPAAQIARQFGLDEERVRLLPVGLVILQAAAERFGRPLQLGHGGVREGVLLESADG